jgi:hypothetical protein
LTPRKSNVSLDKGTLLDISGDSFLTELSDDSLNRQIKQEREDKKQVESQLQELEAQLASNKEHQTDVNKEYRMMQLEILAQKQRE